VRAGRTPINAIDAASPVRSPPFSTPTSPPSSPPRCCSISGTGPVRGFAVTLGIGIITTVFTAVHARAYAPVVRTWVRPWRRIRRRLGRCISASGNTVGDDAEPSVTAKPRTGAGADIEQHRGGE